MYCCWFPTIEFWWVSFTMKAESITKVSIFYILVQVYCCWFPTIEFWRVSFTMKAESVTKVSIFFILVQLYGCCFPTVKFWWVSFTMKAESVTKVIIFYILVQVYCWFYCLFYFVIVDPVKKFDYDCKTDVKRNGDLILLDLAHKSLRTNGSSLTPRRGTSKLSG